VHKCLSGWLTSEDQGVEGVAGQERGGVGCIASECVRQGIQGRVVMPSISSDARIIFGIIAAIAATLSAVIGNVLAINIAWFFSRRGRKPTKRPIRLWIIFYVSAFVSVILGSFAAFAAVPPIDSISSVLRKSIEDAPSEIRSALRNLSTEDFVVLIKEGDDTPGQNHSLVNCATKDEFYQWNPSYLEFERRGLLIVTPNKEDGCDEYKFYWIWTPLGTRSYRFILEVVGNSYGDIRLEVERELITRASEEIKSSVSGLSKDAFLILIVHGIDNPNQGQTNSGLYCDSTKEDFYHAYPGMAELENRGIVGFFYQSFMDCPSELFWHITPLGEDSYKFVIDIIGEGLAKSFR
jgi:hypothetical protein